MIKSELKRTTKKTISTMSGENARLKERIKTLKNSRDKKQRRLTALEQELFDTQVQNATLAERVHDLKNQREMHRNRHKRSERRNEQLQDLLDATEKLCEIKDRELDYKQEQRNKIIARARSALGTSTFWSRVKFANFRATIRFIVNGNSNKPI